MRNNALGGLFDGGLDLKGAVAARSFGRFRRCPLGLRVGLWIRDYHTFRKRWWHHGKIQFRLQAEDAKRTGIGGDADVGIPCFQRSSDSSPWISAPGRVGIEATLNLPGQFGRRGAVFAFGQTMGQFA